MGKDCMINKYRTPLTHTLLKVEKDFLTKKQTGRITQENVDDYDDFCGRNRIHPSLYP